MMDFDGFDQTQAISLDDFSDDTDDLGDPDDKQPSGYLKVYNQKSFNETSFPVYEGDNFIGRHESNQICIPLKALSKKHACIEIQGESHLIYDLESRNKTRRGKLFLKPSIRYELLDHDSLLFGDVRCQYTRVEIQKAQRDLFADHDDDDGSDTDSESMLIHTQATGDTAPGKKEPDCGSSPIQDIIEPTQACKDEQVKTKLILETPQREGASFIFAECSDEDSPPEPVKAVADSSVSPVSIAETPGSKPLAESTVINESEVELSGGAKPSELDASALAMAPTQAYGELAELETQAYPMDTDSDQDDGDEDRGRSLFDAPTQAFGVPDSEDETEQDTRPKRNKRISLEPTLILNLSTDDEMSPIKRPTRPKRFAQNIAEEATLSYNDSDAGETEEGPRGNDDDEAPTLGFPDLATQAYCADTDDQSEEEVDNSSRKSTLTKDDDDEGRTLGYPDLATQMYCVDTDEQSDEEEINKQNSSTAPTLDPTLRYHMQPGSPGARPDQEVAETDTDEGKGEGVEPTLKYDMCVDGDDEGLEGKKGVSSEGVAPTLKYDMGVDEDEDGSEGERGVGVALEPTLAYTTEEDDEGMDISGIAGAATQAYTTTESDSDSEQAQPRFHRPKQPVVPTLSDDDYVDGGISTQSKVGSEDELSSDGGAHCEEATLAYNDEDEAMYSEVAMDEGEEKMLGYEEMETQPAGGMEESEPVCRPDAPTFSYKEPMCQLDAPTLSHKTKVEEDDTIAETQAYGVDEDDDEMPDINETPTTTVSGQPVLAADQDGIGRIEEGKVGMDGVEARSGGRKKNGQEEIDDFVMATQVYGKDEGSETQVPDSQEGAEEDDHPLAGISRISSMLRKVPVRSAMASPEKKQPQKARRVAFKERTPPEDVTPEDINPPSRRSVRGRKVPVRFQETSAKAVTETDAKPTRRKSKDFSLLKEDDDTSDAPKPMKASKGKRKGSLDVVEGQGKAVDGDSSEGTMELKEADDMVWKTTGGFEVLGMNNNETGIKGKPPARRTSRRQESYKKAVEGHDSDGTESLSSTSSLQVEVGEPIESSLKVQVTDCDGKKSDIAVQLPRGRRSSTKRGKSLSKKPVMEVDELALKESRPTTATSGKRQPRRSTVTKTDAAQTVQIAKPGSTRDQHARISDEFPEKEQESKKDVGSSSKTTRSSCNKNSGTENRKTVVASEAPKEAPASAKRGRKPKSVPTLQTMGPKQSSITDFAIAVVQDKRRLESRHDQQSDSLESNYSPSILSPEVAQPKVSSRSRNAKPKISETEAKLHPKQAAKQETFIAPEPVKRGGRSRRGSKEEDNGGQRSVTAPSEIPQHETETPEEVGSSTRDKGRKGGRTSPRLEMQQKQPAATPSSSRRGKRAAPTQTTPSPSPTKIPSLRKRPSAIKPKVMFTGVVSKAWETIVTSLGGELVESVFDCTHLVTDKVRRTVKFLCCLSSGALIIMPNWLNQCRLNKTFVDPSPYLLQDNASEKQYGFSHVTSHQRAAQGGVLAKLCIFVTPNVKPEPDDMKEIIRCAGGKNVNTMPTKPDSSTIIISCEADEAKCQPAIKAGLQVVSAEFILTGMLRQEARPELYQLFTPSSTTGDLGKKRTVNDTPSRSKRSR